MHFLEKLQVCNLLFVTFLSKLPKNHIPRFFDFFVKNAYNRHSFEKMGCKILGFASQIKGVIG